MISHPPGAASFARLPLTRPVGFDFSWSSQTLNKLISLYLNAPTHDEPYETVFVQVGPSHQCARCVIQYRHHVHLGHLRGK